MCCALWRSLPVSISDPGVLIAIAPGPEWILPPQTKVGVYRLNPAGRWLLSLLLRSWVPGHMGIPGRYPRAYDGVRAASLGATRREKRIVYVRCPGLPPGGRSMGNNTPLSDAQALTALGTLWYHRRTGKFTCCPQQPLQSPSSWLDARRSHVLYSASSDGGGSVRQWGNRGVSTG